MEYFCDCCKYATTKRFNYDKHLTSIKHGLIEKSQQTQLLTTTKQHNDNLKTTIELKKVATEFTCKYCERHFRFRQSMYRHIKYTCIKNKEEDLKDRVDLLKRRIEQQETNIEMQKQMLHKIIDEQSLLIDKLIRNVEIRDSFNTTNNIQNIQLVTKDNSEEFYNRLVKKYQESRAKTTELLETKL